MFIKIINIPRRIGILLINIYQKITPKFIRNQCIYYPTCSEYTKQAITKYGLLRGSFKGFLRILRCNPFAKGGVDLLK